MLGTSPMVQLLGLRAPNAGGVGSVPGQGTKIPHATRCSQKEKKNKLNKGKMGMLVLSGLKIYWGVKYFTHTSVIFEFYMMSAQYFCNYTKQEFLKLKKVLDKMLTFTIFFKKENGMHAGRRLSFKASSLRNL